MPPAGVAARAWTGRVTIRVSRVCGPERLGVSRSEFYARAISAFVMRGQSGGTTERLNQVYSEVSSELDPALFQLQLLSLPPTDK